MSRRTRDLPPLTGLPGLVRELRYNEFARQALGLILMMVFALLSSPTLAGFLIGGALALVGMCTRVYASGFIVKNKQLATDGPYSLVRHPLYTGNMLLLMGFTFASGQWWALLVAGAFWWFYYPPAIEYEDRKLDSLFGEQWRAWSADVPAVLPRRVGIKPGGEWSFNKSLRHNLEPVIVIYTLFWLGFIGTRVG
jgi:protein-S-isoprenylcysteine O-methyltransferase Ste14